MAPDGRSNFEPRGVLLSLCCTSNDGVLPLRILLGDEQARDPRAVDAVDPELVGVGLGGITDLRCPSETAQHEPADRLTPSLSKAAPSRSFTTRSGTSPSIA